MKDTRNHGTSFIEILIALVVFTICIIPITNQLMSGIRIGQKADDQQAATEYAQTVAETIKQLELRNTYETSDDETKAILDELKAQLGFTSLTAEHSFYSISRDASGEAVPGSQVSVTTSGTTDITELYRKLNSYNDLPSTTNPEALVRDYTFVGQAEDIDYRDYVVVVNMNTESYALAELESRAEAVANGEDPDEAYQDPNGVNIGNLSSLDSKDTVMLTQLSNLDTEAYNAFFTRIITVLEDMGGFDAYITNLKSGALRLPGTVTKKINVNVTDAATGSGNQCRVVCTVTYEITLNSSTISGTSEEKTALLAAFSGMNKQVIYTPISQEYSNIPDIYLMYNQFMYDGDYGNDVIQINNQLSAKETVNAYVIRTAENDSKAINISPGNADGSAADPTSASSLLPDNYRDVKSGGRYRYTTSFQINTTGQLTKASYEEHPVRIYTNAYPADDTYASGAIKVESAYGGATPVGTYKLSTNVASDITAILPLSEDERYSDTGRLYDVTVTLYDPDTYDMSLTPAENKDSKIVEFNTSKGDY